MRRRLIRLVALGLVVPAAARAAGIAADRLEANQGPSKASRSLRAAGAFAARNNRNRRWR